LEVPADFPSAPTGAPKEPKIEARGEVFIPVRNLKAAGKTWEPDNEQITVAMHRMLRAQEHPKILFRLTEPLAPMRRASTATTYAFEATGDLVIAGTTNRISMPLEVAPLTTNKLKLSGRAKLKQSDFKVIPKPKPVLDSWDNDSVEIAFEWMVEQKQDHEAVHGSRSN
jgi:polyisoprenoid-binding protein YceI